MADLTKLFAIPGVDFRYPRFDQNNKSAPIAEITRDGGKTWSPWCPCVEDGKPICDAWRAKC